MRIWLVVFHVLVARESPEARVMREHKRPVFAG
jgi:hypothetical protein